MNTPDQDLLDFLETKDADYADTESRAKLVDDICENGQRELTNDERFLAQRMFEQYRNTRRLPNP